MDADEVEYLGTGIIESFSYYYSLSIQILTKK